MQVAAEALLFLLLFLLLLAAAALNSDGETLLSFKRAIFSDPDGTMGDWDDSEPTPCRWSGVSCATIRGESEPRVNGLNLARKRLIGSISADLGSLHYLSRLNLRDNQLIGSIPPQLFNASALQVLLLADNDLSGAIPASIATLAPSLQTLDLSGNGFTSRIPDAIAACSKLQVLLLASNKLSGGIPPELGRLSAIQRLDLSSNRLTGRIPDELGSLSALVGTLNLSSNNLSGAIPTSLGRLPISLSIDLSFNNLSGPVPLTGSLSNQGPTAFLGNPLLCGVPLKNRCAPPPATGAQMPPFSSRNPFYPPSRSGSTNTSSSSSSSNRRSSRGGMSTMEIVAIAAGDAVGVSMLLAAAIFCFVLCRRRRRRRRSSSSGSVRLESEVAMDELLTGGELQHFDAEAGKLFDMESLLRAAAFVIGKGGSGIVYRAVLGSGGGVVVVRRLGEGGGGSRRIREFDSEVKAIGCIRHPHVVPLRAYYWGANEKLLVYDFLPNGSLASALQQHQRFLLLRGQQQDGQQDDEDDMPACLSWQQRLWIAKGAARGLSHLHEGVAKKGSSSSSSGVHGNVKPSNILLDSKMDALISDFGISKLTEILAAHERVVSTSSSLRSLTGTAGTAAAAAPAAGSSVENSTSKSARFVVPNNGELALISDSLSSLSKLDDPSHKQQQNGSNSSSSLSLYTASTSIYRPPEAAAAAAKPTQKWDVYSFGVVLLELLTGSASAQLSSSDADTVAAVRRMLAGCLVGCQQGRRPLHLDVELDAELESAESAAMAVLQLANRCLAASPEQRPRMKQVAEGLEAIG